MTSESNNSYMRLLAERFACRAYSSRPVSREDILSVLESARLAPSAKNKQPWIFVVLESEADREAVIRSYNRGWIASAPVCIVACADHSRSWRRADGKDHADIDLAIAGEHISLAATSIGLATCWVCNFNVMQLAGELGLAEGIEPVAIFPLGYPADGVHAPVKSRRSMEDIVKWGK